MATRGKRKIIVNEEESNADTELVKANQNTKDALEDAVLTADAIERFPDLVDLSERDMLVMMAYAHGFRYRYISRAVGISATRICQIIKQHDPCGRYKMDDESMKVFIKKSALALQAEAIASITPEKLEEENASSLSKIAETGAKIVAQQERVNDHLDDKRIKKVTVEFVDNVEDMQEAQIEELEQ